MIIRVIGDLGKFRAFYTAPTNNLLVVITKYYKRRVRKFFYY